MKHLNLIGQSFRVIVRFSNTGKQTDDISRCYTFGPFVFERRRYNKTTLPKINELLDHILHNISCKINQWPQNFINEFKSKSKRFGAKIFQSLTWSCKLVEITLNNKHTCIYRRTKFHNIFLLTQTKLDFKKSSVSHYKSPTIPPLKVRNITLYLKMPNYK